MSDPFWPTNFKDWVATLSSAFAPLVAIIVYRLQLNEKAYGSVEWRYHQCHDDDYEMFVVLVIHNRSDQSVAIKDIRYRTGIFRRSCSKYMANYCDDPTDIDFPFSVEPGKMKALRLDEAQAAREAKSTSCVANLLSRIGYPRIWVQAVTTTGNTITVSAEGVIPYEDRPAWLQDARDD